MNLSWSPISNRVVQNGFDVYAHSFVFKHTGTNLSESVVQRWVSTPRNGRKTKCNR